MSEIKVGKWTIEVTSPYPCWVRVSFEDQEPLLHANHRDLRDLEYAVQKAMRVAREKLPEREREEV